MKTFKITVALVIVVVIFLFSVHNSQPVEIVFFRYSTPPVPLFLIIVFMFLLGLLLTSLLVTVRMSHLNRQIGNIRRENDLLRRENDSLRREREALREDDVVGELPPQAL